MAAPRDPMRRHFSVTLWMDAEGASFAVDGGYRDFSPIVELIIETARTCRAHFVGWSLEDASLKPDTERKTGKKSENDSTKGVHFHAYIECERSIRWSTVVRRFQGSFQGAHVECRSGWRTTAREYHTGYRHGEEKVERILSGEWGEFREEDAGDKPDDIPQEAADMIVRGMNPTQVAQKFPRWFIRNGYGVIRLWETLNRQGWGR